MSKESKTMEREAQVKARAKEPWTARRVGDLILNNALIIIMVIAVIYIAIVNKNFMKPASIINILAQTCAYLPVALGVGGCIVLTGTDLSAGRIVGLTACISASLLQAVDAASKMWPNLTPPPVILVLILAMIIGGAIGAFNGFFVAVQAASLHRHPGHPADYLHPAAAVCEGRREQRHGHLGP